MLHWFHPLQVLTDGLADSTYETRFQNTLIQWSPITKYQETRKFFRHNGAIFLAGFSSVHSTVTRDWNRESKHFEPQRWKQRKSIKAVSTK